MRNTIAVLLTRDHGTPLETRDAAIRPNTFRAADNTIEAIIATGSPIQRGNVWEILPPQNAQLDALRGAHVLDGHRQGDGVAAILGTVIDGWVEGDQLIARLQLTGNERHAGTVADIAAGVIRAVSIGFEVSEWQQGTDGQGRRTMTALRWTPREVSFVGVPADPRARTRAQDNGERAAIIDLCGRAGVPAATREQLLALGGTVEDARRLALNELLTRSATPIRAVVGTDYSGPEAQSRAMGDAIYSRLSGNAPSGPARDLMHRSLIDLMAHHCRVNGIPLRNESPAEIFQTAMLTRGVGGMSSSDFPIVLADTMNRRLGELFRAAESGASAIVASGTARDFRPITEARVTSFPSLEPISETGEIRFASLTEEGEALAIASFARAVNVSFKLIVNDDLGAIDRSIRDTAFATAVLKAKLIIAALSANLSDGKPLFHADHNNLSDTGAAPDTSKLSDGRVAMMKQTPPGSTEPLGLSPAILLVPAELQTTAEKLVTSINPTASDDVNVFAGRLQVAVEPRLPDEYQWFLFASPGTYPVLRFLTLAGFESPRFETSQEFDRLGTSYRVHWHCGAGSVDWRGAWKNAGH